VGSSEIALIAFGSIAVVTWAGALVIRDVLFPRRTATAGGTTTVTGRRRQPTVLEQRPAQGLIGKIDQGFDRLVVESADDASPAGAFLWIVLCATLAGGCLWIYSEQPVAAMGGGIAGAIIPLIVMAVQRARRTNEIREQFPQVLDMLARATRAGQSVDQAIHLVGEEESGVLGREFRRCSQQLEMGRRFDKVMQTLASRVRLVEMRIFASTLIVQRQTGGPLSETLERMSSVVRDRINAKRQIRASTGAGRTSTMIVAGIAPVAYAAMFLFHRPHIQYLIDDPLGRGLLLGAVVLQALGLAWVFSILKREE